MKYNWRLVDKIVTTGQIACLIWIVIKLIG